MTALLLNIMNTHHHTRRPATMVSSLATKATLYPEATRADENNVIVGSKRIRDTDSCYASQKLGANKRQRLNNNNNSYNNNKKSAAKKSVRFAVTPDNNIQQSVIVVPRVEDIDIPHVWYSTEEFHLQRSRDYHSLQSYAQNDTYRNDLFQVLGAACGKLDETVKTHGACVALSSSPIRGLERETTPCFRQRKKHVVANVLKSQAALMAWKTNNTQKVDANGTASRILAGHYQKLALPAGRFARLLGEGDALFATQTSSSTTGAENRC